MAHDHPTLIKEAPSELLEHERRHRHSITSSRIRMLRLLKRGEAKSVREASEPIGYSWRHTQRWLTTYRKGGLQALLTAPKQRGGKWIDDPSRGGRAQRSHEAR